MRSHRAPPVTDGPLHAVHHQPADGQPERLDGVLQAGEWDGPGPGKVAKEFFGGENGRLVGVGRCVHFPFFSSLDDVFSS